MIIDKDLPKNPEKTSRSIACKCGKRKQVTRSSVDSPEKIERICREEAKRGVALRFEFILDIVIAAL